MKLSPFHSLLRSGFLILWVSQCETEDINSDVCQESRVGELIVQGSSFKEYSVDKREVDETFSCHLYPTNMVNCSWSFDTLPKDTQLSVYISICDEDTSVWTHSSEERAGSWSLPFNEDLFIDVIIQFNMSLPGNWKFYTYMYDMDMLEVLSPPSNISASVKDGNLLVTWELPVSRITENPECFEYELALDDQERDKSLTNQLFYKVLHDPTHTYRVKIRAMKMDHCSGGPKWSKWSDTVTVERSVYKLNMLVIISISLGIPMILLAVLLLVRHQRVSKLLFPPIPRPPPKYINFLEKSDTPTFFYPVQAAKAEEEITEVEDTEEDTGKKL